MPAQALSTKPAALPLHDAESLRRSGRGTVAPFVLLLKARDTPQTLVCHEILRNLPAKRLVCFGTWEGQEAVVAKIYLDRRRGQKHFQRELHGIGALEAARIPTPALLYRGMLADGRTPVLLTRRITTATDLTKILAAHPRKDEALRVLSPVVTAVAGLHAAGLRQRDIHGGNFLLTGEAVLVIDGADIQSRGKPLAQGPSIANLGLFLAQLIPELDDILPDLIARYCRARAWTLSTTLRRQIEKAVARWRDWREQKFLQKTLRPCTAFMARKTWQRFMVCDRANWSAVLERLLDDPEQAMAAGTVLKAGNSATVVKIEIADRPLVVKRYNLKNRRHALGRTLRPTRAAASWRNANRLRFMGVATPRPLAFVEERWGPLRRRAYFIADFVDGDSIARVVAENPTDPVVLASCADHLGLLMHRLHQLRLSHGDLKASNLILAEGRLYLLDLDGMRKHRRSNAFQRAFRKDVRRLCANWRPNDTFTALLNARIREIDRHA